VTTPNENPVPEANEDGMTAETTNTVSEPVAQPEEKPKHEMFEDDEIEAITVPRAAFNYAVVAIVFFAIGALLGSFVFPSGGTGAALPEDFEAIVRQAVADGIAESGVAVAEAEQERAVQGQRYDVVANAGEDPSWGNPDALVTIVEFSDFTCGFCGRFASETMPALQEEFGDQIRFVYMDFPFLSQMSVPAALAGECADDQGQFWEFHDQLFANQRSLSVDALFTIAEDIELDMDAFQTCYDDSAHMEEIAADYEYGAQFGVSGTPAFFINGTFVSGAQPIEVFRSAIQQELEVAAATENET
jgi:protein-disulfide isomerase